MKDLPKTVIKFLNILFFPTLKCIHKELFLSNSTYTYFYELNYYYLILNLM